MAQCLICYGMVSILTNSDDWAQCSCYPEPPNISEYDWERLSREREMILDEAREHPGG